MRGHKPSKDLYNVIIHMLPVLDVSDIEAYTGVSKSRIQRVQALYNRTGLGYKARDTRMMRRCRKLTLENIQLSEIKLLAFSHLKFSSTVCAGSLGSQL
jgi:hypothetical protein